MKSSQKKKREKQKDFRVCEPKNQEQKKHKKKKKKKKLTCQYYIFFIITDSFPENKVKSREKEAKCR